ncbi:2-oxo-4-hydroxy-4-carboxy-5-ureidoimidazoline decarboxylase [Alosa sapidissima]|uniref:2-oxo-4-hydroxy-4-carboxy-5-ureidoimidazoline decarboxylase n=1 Tax=Alosa sapidissima TaxID=34773 RepID=UPI001C09F6E1|nr:2-oxo-4-hydroxy-4-carboxy-5-ureidoimidazoline decarboxylase [Alosa sapidissima]
MDISSANSLSYEDFVDIFGNVVEKNPLIAAAIWSHRPFANLSELEARIVEFIDKLPESGKEGILRCHPDLAGRDLQRGTLTRDSQDEQSQAGMASLTPEETARMYRLNTEYKRRFGFPFIICAKMNNKAAILRKLSERSGNDLAKERECAIDEVKKISSLRLRNLVLPDTQHKL